MIKLPLRKHLVVHEIMRQPSDLLKENGHGAGSNDQG